MFYGPRDPKVCEEFRRNRESIKLLINRETEKNCSLLNKIGIIIPEEIKEIELISIEGSKVNLYGEAKEGYNIKFFHNIYDLNSGKVIEKNSFESCLCHISPKEREWTKKLEESKKKILEDNQGK